jgi:hypothetical protein
MSNDEVSNDLYVIIIQKSNTKSSVGQYGPPIKANVDLVPWRSKHPLLTSQTHRAPLIETRCTGLSIVKDNIIKGIKPFI